MKYIELFSGIGGFRKACELLNNDYKLNFKCIGYSENDKHALKTYESNFSINGEVSMHDIVKFTSKNENINKLKDIDLLLGGFPCQAFSLMGKKEGFNDERGSVLFSIHKLLKLKKPTFIILENVRNIEKHNNGNTINSIIIFLKRHNYIYIKKVVLDTQNFGLPQKRKRVFIICSLENIQIDLNEKLIIENYIKIQDKSSLFKYKDVLDILEKKVDNKYYLSERIKHTILADGSNNFISKSQIDLPIARTLTATMVKLHRACQDNYYSDDYIINGISHRNTPKDMLLKMPIRRITPKEALNLQGFDNQFFRNAIKSSVSEHQIYKQAGNALSVNTGYALLHYLFVKLKIQNK